MSVLSPKESGDFIAKNAKFVKINEDGVHKLALEVVEQYKAGAISVSGYGEDGIHPGKEEGRLVDWMFVLDVLNFCFWTPGDDTKWRVEGETGYMALGAAINRAVKEGIDITNPAYYATISESTLGHILRSDDGLTQVPLLPTRVQCLHEVGGVLVDRFQGMFRTCVEQADTSAVKLLQIIIDNFPCFRDEATFEGQRVSFYKRAQIAVADLWSRFQGRDMGQFPDIGEMTMFADYRVPQVLVYFGALEYTQELMDLLKQDKILESGCREEVEIRGCSIHCVELVTAEAKRIMQAEGLDASGLNAVLIDFHLWMYRRRHAKELEYIPFHKVLGRFY